MMNKNKVMNWLALGWLLRAVGVGAFPAISRTISSTSPGQQTQPPRHSLRTPTEIRPFENLFSSTVATRNKASNVGLQHLQLLTNKRLVYRSVIPLFQSPQTETLSKTGSSTSYSSFSSSGTTRHINSNKSQHQRERQQQERAGASARSWLPFVIPSNPIVSRGAWRRWSKQAVLVAEDVQEARERCAGAALRLVRNFWWMLPLWSLSLVPLYTVAVFQALPETPHFWKLVSMEQVLTAWIAPFLASNASYYVAAAHLFFRSAAGKQQYQLRLQPQLQEQPQPQPQQYSNSNGNNKSLALWTLSAGTVSTIFHTVQSLGHYRAAEALCFIDHGVAGTAVLHFWHVCGAPSRRTWALGAAGLACLACPGDLYPALHSLWHGLSALTAVVWARDAEAAGQPTAETATAE